MILNDKIKVGNRVSLESVQTSKTAEQRIYKSRILDILDEYTYEIAIPIEQGHMVPLEKGRRFLVIYYTDAGLYQNECIVKDRYQKEHIYTLCMDSVSKLAKIQRREYFRLPCDILMRYRLISMREKFLVERLLMSDKMSMQEESLLKKEILEAQEEHQWTDAQVADISGGGVRFKNHEPLEKGTHLQMKLNMKLPKNQGFIDLNGIIVDSESKADHIFEQRVKFEDISDDLREAIIKFIFEEQLRLRNQ